MGKLILVRHGHTAMNCPGAEERLRAWIDVPLDKRGIDEAQNLAAQLAEQRVDVIVCSDLKRARRTAEIIRKLTQAPLKTTEELRPWNLGAFAGHRLVELLPFLNLLSQHPSLPAPGGESFYDFFDRYARRLAALMKAAERTPNSIVAVTHVRNLLATETILQGGTRESVPVKGGPPTGTLVVIEKKNGKWVMGTKREGAAKVTVPVTSIAEATRTPLAGRGAQWVRR